MTIILGADLSLSRTGLVWLDHAFKVIFFQEFSFKPGPKRMLRICKALKDCFTEHPADFAVIEDLAYGAASRTVVAKLAELGAVTKLVLEGLDIDYLLVSPSMVKKEITGKGNAEKPVVAQELKRLYKIEFKNDPGYDLSDAAAVASWGVQHLQKAAK